MQPGYNAVASWNSEYRGGAIAYPAEGVIRILKGRFPGLKMPNDLNGKVFLDVGCGDGRHLPLAASLGMIASGMEISDEIASVVVANMRRLEIPAQIRVGTSERIPFPESFCSIVLSWNSCYYMSLSEAGFEKHVDELARVVQPGGMLICSIPMVSSFIFKDARRLDDKRYCRIQDDYFGQRNGEVMRIFESREEIVQEFARWFTNFCHADVVMDWFGLNYHWHVFVAERTTSRSKVT